MGFEQRSGATLAIPFQAFSDAQGLGESVLGCLIADWQGWKSRLPKWTLLVGLGRGL